MQHPDLATLFQRVGEAVSAYQSIEDDLLWLFVYAMDGHPRAGAVFETLRGVESKLDSIRAALPTEELSSEFAMLSKEIKLAQDRRNHIAHSVAQVHDTSQIDFRPQVGDAPAQVMVHLGAKPGYVSVSRGGWKDKELRISDIDKMIGIFREIHRKERIFVEKLRLRADIVTSAHRTQTDDKTPTQP